MRPRTRRCLSARRSRRFDSGSSPLASETVVAADKRSPLRSASGRDRDLLVAAFGLDAFKAKRGRSLALRYVASRPSAVRVDVIKGRKVIAKASARARRGRNKITLRRIKAAGRLKLRLTATVDNQTSTDTARLIVSRR